MRKLTTEEWIEKAKLVHGNTYDYSNTVYKSANDKLNIKCKIHGDFSQRASAHLSGQGCKVCGRIRTNELQRKDPKNFIKECETIHNFKYDYSKTEYKGAHEKIIVICKIHGEFSQVAHSHLEGYGCPSCAIASRTKSIEKFIEDANNIHNNRYNYSKSEYINSEEKVCIICEKHGEFWQTPANHLSYHGCPKCHNSIGEQIIENWAVKNNIKYIPQLQIELEGIGKKSNKAIIDFLIFLNDRQYMIEYHGLQHYEFTEHFHRTQENFELQLRRDLLVKQYCLDNNIEYVEISYTRSPDKINELLNKLINE